MTSHGRGGAPGPRCEEKHHLRYVTSIEPRALERGHQEGRGEGLEKGLLVRGKASERSIDQFGASAFTSGSAAVVCRPVATRSAPV